MNEILEIRDNPQPKFFRGFWLCLSILIGCFCFLLSFVILAIFDPEGVWARIYGNGDTIQIAIGVFAISSATAYLALKTDLGLILSLVLVVTGLIVFTIGGALLDIHPLIHRVPQNEGLNPEYAVWVLFPPWITTLGITCSREFSVE